MSLKYKTERGILKILEDAGVGESLTLYGSQEDATGRKLPCAIVNCDETNPPATRQTGQQRRRLIISILATAVRPKASDPDPGELMAAAVDLTLDPLLDKMLKKTFATDLTAAVEAAGLDQFTCLFASYSGPIATAPLAKTLVESFAFELALIEANC